MPSLSLKTWRRWDLNIGDNLKRPEGERAFLEVRTGMTRLERDAFELAMQAAVAGGDRPTMAAELAKTLAPWARMGGAGFEIDGQPMQSIDDLCRIGMEEASVSVVIDVSGGVRYWNGIGSARDLFTERLSGGGPGTEPKPG